MLQITKVVSIILLFAITSVAGAQMPDPLSPEIDEYVRVKHDRSQSLPLGIAYRELIRILNYDAETGDTAFSVGWIQDELSMDEPEASSFVTQSVEAFRNLEADNSAAEKALACAYGNPSTYNSEVYSVLHKMDDVREDIAEQYYQEAKARFEGDDATRFEEWIASRKTKTVYIKFDHEKADEVTGRDSTALLSDICNRGGAQ